MSEESGDFVRAEVDVVKEPEKTEEPPVQNSEPEKPPETVEVIKEVEPELEVEKKDEEIVEIPEEEKEESEGEFVRVKESDGALLSDNFKNKFYIKVLQCSFLYVFAIHI